jgi:hypothetical protein
MSADYFFASYARADKNRALLKFVTALRRELREAAGLNLDERQLDRIGFFDLTTIETGDDWLRVLGNGVRTCKVCICLCSNTYFNRPFCGKEYHVFSVRRDAWLGLPGNAGKPARVIVPVLWSPVEDPPAGFLFLQDDRNLYPESYRTSGLKALADNNGQRTAFGKAVHAIACVVWEAVRDVQLPPLPSLPQFDKIPSDFHRPTPYGVVLISLHPKGVHWPIFGGGAIYSELEAIAAQLRTRLRAVPADAGVGLDDLVRTLRETHENREAVVILATPDLALRAAGDPRFEALRDLRNFALLVAWDGAGGQPAGAVDALRAARPWLAATGGFHDLASITTAEQLRGQVSAAITGLRRALVTSDKVVPAADATLEMAARDQGIPIDHAAVLSAAVKTP